MSYTSLDDPVDAAVPEGFCAGKFMIKFCSMGLVTSSKWSTVWITLGDGILRVYDSEDSCSANAQSYVLQILLGKRHRASEVKTKNYSDNPLRVIDFFCFYIQLDNGIFQPTRQLKVASTDPKLVENFVASVDLNVEN